MDFVIEDKLLWIDCNLRNMRWHDLRHTYATVLKKNDISLKAISACMGHNGTEVTKDVYINLLSDKDLLELLPQKVYNMAG